MDDKGIRKILAAYLKSVNAEVRIFEEKSVGTSACGESELQDELFLPHPALQNKVKRITINPIGFDKLRLYISN